MIAGTYVQLCGHFVGLVVWQGNAGLVKKIFISYLAVNQRKWLKRNYCLSIREKEGIR
jgi:hypothetical protein